MTHVHRDKCEACVDGLGWVWNLHTQDAEPCPLCDGHGEADVLIGSTTWGNDGCEPIHATQHCQECRGTGLKTTKAAPPRRSPVNEERLPF